MTEELHKSTQDLIGQIERKDRRFRLAQSVFMISTLLALVIVISAQQRTLNSVKEQLVQAKATAEQQSKQSDDQRDKIIRRLDCIVVFFTQANRQEVTIDDIDKCSLNRDQTVPQFFQQPEPTESDQPPDLSPAGNAGSTPQAQTPTIPQQPETPPEDPPVEILGVPICVPFTGLCVK